VGNRNPKYNNTMKARICDGNLNPNENEIKEICKGIYLTELCSELTSAKERRR
jgi:hypothetical protein